MLSIPLTFFLVFLGGVNAALPDVGKCTFMEYYCNALVCNTRFIKNLQKDASVDCGVEFKSMVSCVKKVILHCAGDQLSESSIDTVIASSFKEKTACMEGSFEVPSSQPGLTLPCSSSFLQNAPECGRKFHETWNASRSDPALCSEYASSKKCLKDLMTSDCWFDSLTQEALNLALSDYNPYCDDNRDPDASGKGQCDGIELYNAAGRPTYALSALLVSGGITLLLAVMI